MDELLNAARSVLGIVAPTLAAALGGPLAGMAVKSIADVLGLYPNASEKDVYTEVVNANPETLLKLKELETTFKIQMKKLDVDILSLENSDRDSARRREVDLKDNTNKYMAFGIIILYALIQLGIMFSGIEIADGMRDIVLRSLGTLDGIIVAIISYYFGSSSGSLAKTKQIDTLINNGSK